MDNNLDALRSLYVALGGDADDVADLVTNPDLINAIADLITTNGIAALPTGTSGQVLTMGNDGWAAADIPAQLPTVAAANNGEVLTVVEGEWAAADIPAQLPEVAAADNSKVLTVVEGEWAAAALPE